MKTTVDKKDLINELAIAKKISSKKCNLAVCQCAVVTLKYSSVIIETTDLENYRVGVVGENPYRLYDAPKSFPSILVPVAAFMKAVKAFPKKQETVTLEIDENKCLMINGKITLVNFGKDVDDFPELPKFPHTGFISKGLDSNTARPRGFEVFDQVILTQALNSGRVTADERRPHITGLYLDFEHGNVAGTDGNKLHVSKMLMNRNGYNKQHSYDPVYDSNVLMPRTFANLLLCPQLKNQIGNVTVTDKYIFVETGQTGFVCSRLLEGEFPNYLDLVWPNSYESVLSFPDKQYLFEILSEARAILDQDYIGMTVNMGESLVVNTVHPDIGMYEFEFDKKDYEYAGDEIEAAFNPAMLMDSMNCINDKGVNMYLRGAEHPLWIQSNDQAFNAYVMPMRI